MAKEEAKEWFKRAEKDIEEAEFLFNNNRPLENVGLFIQQAVEKYLKGFLIYHGWELRKIHDLISLLGDVIEIDKEFEKFSDALQVITKYYLDSRYPLGYSLEYTKEDIRESITSAKAIISLIKKKLSP
ncbi:MAG: HEPN domain-containing protein [Candidatus Omnitrophota bacterium]|nr:HEPN domain-containing protein [Candidatus Omnitrophota bacterium]